MHKIFIKIGFFAIIGNNNLPIKTTILVTFLLALSYEKKNVTVCRSQTRNT